MLKQMKVKEYPNTKKRKNPKLTEKDRISTVMRQKEEIKPFQPKMQQNPIPLALSTYHYN
jgi:hypothetical protein